MNQARSRPAPGPGCMIRRAPGVTTFECSKHLQGLRALKKCPRCPVAPLQGTAFECSKRLQGCPALKKCPLGRVTAAGGDRFRGPEVLPGSPGPHNLSVRSAASPARGRLLSARSACKTAQPSKAVPLGGLHGLKGTGFEGCRCLQGLPALKPCPLQALEGRQRGQLLSARSAPWAFQHSKPVTRERFEGRTGTGFECTRGSTPANPQKLSPLRRPDRAAPLHGYPAHACAGPRNRQPSKRRSRGPRRPQAHLRQPAPCPREPAWHPQGREPASPQGLRLRRLQRAPAPPATRPARATDPGRRWTARRQRARPCLEHSKVDPLGTHIHIPKPSKPAPLVLISTPPNPQTLPPKHSKGVPKTHPSACRQRRKPRLKV